MHRWLDSPRVTTYASLTTLAIGLFFVFVWAPHPWGWRGIDQYDQLAREVVRGEPFNTTDVPWGYTYFLAACLALFGERSWVPVTIQAVFNALTPLLVFTLAQPALGRRIAALATWITAVFSFNTVYASTLTSDSICTVLFLLALVCFVRGHRRSSMLAFAAAGALAGLVPQFRPNMILLPLFVAAGYVFWPQVSPELDGKRASVGGRLIHSGVFIAAMMTMMLPWIVRNYQYTSMLLPTSTHGGIQLWYGTLQTGPYLESSTHNPRYIFASPAFHYTSLEQPIIFTGGTGCVPPGAKPRLVYRTSRDHQLRTVEGRHIRNDRYTFEIPAQIAPTTVYYFFDAGGATTPPSGNAGPLIYFVSKDHLGDLDTRNEVLDIFDIVRMAKVEGNRAGLALAVAALIPEASGPFASLDVTSDATIVRLRDGSSVSIPREFGGLHTDLDVRGELAGTLVGRWRTISSLQDTRTCPAMDEIQVNEVFYRREPHMMARYTALAFDNISRDPLAFAAASAYRMVRMFIIRGTGDRLITFQFPFSRQIFQAGTVASLLYFATFLAGVAIAWRARSPFLYALIPIVYVPVTICFVLTNMRYTITVQPLMFVFVAIAVAALLGIGSPSPRQAPSRHGPARGVVSLG